MRRVVTLAGIVALVFLVASIVVGCGGAGTTTTTAPPAETTTTGAPTDTTAGSGTTEPPAASAPKVEIKVIAAWAEGNINNAALAILQEKVLEKSGGSVEIVWNGGPEAIPTNQLGEALRNGVTDMAWTAHTFNVAQIPILEAAKLSKLLPWEERDAGVADFWDKQYNEKMNAHYLGRGTPGLTYNLYTTFPVASVADFKGRTIRVTPAYKAFVEALGAAPVTTDPGEVYTSLERHLVEGYGWPSVGITDFGWDEVTKYVVEPAFYQVDVCGIVNLKVWEKLTPEQQNAVTEAMAETERAAYDFFNKAIAEDRALITGKGIQEATLEGSEAEQYLKLAHDAAWNAVMAKDPAQAAELQAKIDK